MKRTRRIEIVGYSRRVTWISEKNATDSFDGPVPGVLLETLGDSVAVQGASRQEIEVAVAARPCAGLLRRLLRLRKRNGFPHLGSTKGEINHEE